MSSVKSTMTEMVFTDDSFAWINLKFHPIKLHADLTDALARETVKFICVTLLSISIKLIHRERWSGTIRQVCDILKQFLWFYLMSEELIRSIQYDNL